MSEHFMDGWDAYWNGENERDNPNVDGALAYVQWEQGWSAAQDDHSDNKQGITNYN